MNASFGFTLSTDWQKRCCNLEGLVTQKTWRKVLKKTCPLRIVILPNCDKTTDMLYWERNPIQISFFSREQEIANLSKVEVVEVWCGNLNAVLLLPALVSPVSFYFQILLWSILSEVKYGSRLQTLVWEELSGVKCCGSLGRILIEFHFGKGKKPS